MSGHHRAKCRPQQNVDLIGQQREGFYNCCGLEDIVGCNIMAATGLDPRFETLMVGDSLIQHPQSPPLTVPMVDDGTDFVLLGGDQIRETEHYGRSTFAPLPVGELD